ncbi:hypothetical protein CUT44_11980 [Streptomyces carminius]|uniref:Uncharacterized protein n=1 Tax=Streptomyces carminius TaxID=2665496 RepID=A0A2M8LZN2_9ACTN|nr:hypothetical protein [Streptomyces carminius]PJE97401.1 hypothetical protein CUT44_11980 [Streptomyces carminius]
MRPLWRRKRALALVACAVVTTAVAATVVVRAESAERAERHAEQLDANRARAQKACAGLLPAEHLAAFLPEDSAARTEEYGTLLDPGQESRALADCLLGWEGGEQVRLRVAPWSPEDEEPADDMYRWLFPYRLPDGFSGVSDREGAEASLRVPCPDGPPGRLRLGTDLKVSVGMPVHRGEGEYSPSGKNRTLLADWAVRVADWVGERQGCGTQPLGDLPPAPDPEGDEETETEEPDTRESRGTGLCAWLDPAAMGHVPDGLWDVSGDPSFDAARGECRAYLEVGAGEKEIKGVSAASASGVAARRFYQTGEADPYDDSSRSPGPARAPEPGGRHTGTWGDFTPAPVNEDTLPSLALWAESVCDGGQTFHRVTVTPEFGYRLDQGDTIEDPGYRPDADLDRETRRKMSEEAEAVLDRYLQAPGGWPERAGCRDTTVLGEVEEWRIPVGG